jgi:hypothetical protein
LAQDEYDDSDTEPSVEEATSVSREEKDVVERKRTRVLVALLLGFTG